MKVDPRSDVMRKAWAQSPHSPGLLAAPDLEAVPVVLSSIIPDSGFYERVLLPLTTGH
jgi:hypothetical protein